METTQPRLKRSLRITFLGLALNILLAAVKLVAGVVGHSHALVADAVESFADVCSSLVVWRGLTIAESPPDDDHPYGHGKAEAISAAIVAGLLLAAAAWIAMKAVAGIISPKAAPAPFTLIVLFVVIVVKEALFRFALHESRIVDSTALRSDAWHHRSDAITSLAAGLGITIALVGGEGFEAADGIAAMFASGIIFWNGWRLMRPALDDLMDASAKPELIADIRRAAETVPKAGRVEKCLVRRMGAQLLVDMHLQVKPDMTVMEAHQVAHAVKDVVRQEHPRVLDVLVHVEPLEELVAVRSESLEEGGHG